MIILSSTGKLQVKLGGAVTTSQLQIVASFADYTATAAPVPGFSTLPTNNGTAVDAVPSPAGGTLRKVNYLSVENKDTVSETATVYYNDAGTQREVVVIALAAGTSLCYETGKGWYVFSATAGGTVNALTSGHLYVGNGSNVAADVAASGDVSLANTGAFAVLQAAGAFNFAGVISPTQIAADVNDYSPTGLAAAARLRLTTDASRRITGIAGGVDGRILKVTNVGSFDLVLRTDTDTSSTAANRIAVWYGYDLTLSPGQMVELVYDGANSRWRCGDQSCPVPGEFREFAGSTIPTGFLACDGSSLLRTTYAGLFAAIGTTWGSVDGTHFTLPDFRGRGTIGDGTGTGLSARTLGATGGEETHLLITSEMPSHTHTIVTTTLSYAAGGAFFSVGQGGAAASSGPQGGGLVHNNMQPFAVVKKIIKY